MTTFAKTPVFVATLLVTIFNKGHERFWLCGMPVCRDGRSEGARGAWGVRRAPVKELVVELLLRVGFGLTAGLHFPFL